jgi:hypothetical protein
LPFGREHRVDTRDVLLGLVGLGVSIKQDLIAA